MTVPGVLTAYAGDAGPVAPPVDAGSGREGHEAGLSSLYQGKPLLPGDIAKYDIDVEAAIVGTKATADGAYRAIDDLIVRDRTDIRAICLSGCCKSNSPGVLQRSIVKVANVEVR